MYFISATSYCDTVKLRHPVALSGALDSANDNTQIIYIDVLGLFYDAQVMYRTQIKAITQRRWAATPLATARTD